MQSTPFALLTHEVAGLDIYISGYARFYLLEAGNDDTWLSQVFQNAKRNAKVSPASDTFILLI